MAQFTIYQSSDWGAPSMNGLTGSLLNVLNQVLVTGYGNKPGAGWTKPFNDTSSYGMITQGTGSTCSLFVQDAGPGAGVGLEARLTGWETITSMDNGKVTGSGQFPTVVQSAFGQGAVLYRKSIAATTVTRPWMIFADSSSFYLYTLTGDNAGYYYSMFFGDFFSIKSGSIDQYKCMIIGRGEGENNSSLTYDKLDVTAGISSAGTANHYIARTYTGVGGSVMASKGIDGGKFTTATMIGIMTSGLNGPDLGRYICPVSVQQTGIIRGRMRGFWSYCHAPASISDGQLIVGQGAFAGKQFVVVKLLGNASPVLMEISDTLETN
jgi:hypothetical protein